MNGLTNITLDFLPDRPDGVYLVGGTVRDLLAGRSPTDIDLVVSGDITGVAGHIAARTGGRVIDLGKNGFAVLRVASPDTIIDITPLAHPSIEADLQQRDFTINAMAYDLKARRLVDCTGGQADMQNQTVRMVSPTAFEKDPARLVRAYRMAATLHFSIDAGTQDAIGRHRHLVTGVAGERVWAELVKIFGTADSGPVVMRMAASGLLTAIFPELQAAVGCTQNRHHQFDVFDHSLRVYTRLEALLADFDSHFPDLTATEDAAKLHGHAAMLKYSALLHDAGKPATRSVDSRGRVGFPGHAAKSADITAGVSRRLRLSNRQRHVSDAIIRHHIRPLFLYLASENGTLGRRGMIRFFNRCGDLALPIIVHAMADIMAKSEVLQARDNGFIFFCDRLVAAYVDTRRRKAAVPPLISGRDLIAVLGLSPSPRFKSILREVDERRLSGELTTRDQALEWVGTHLLPHDVSRRAED
ncbi:tRNA nucleotidyltransferase [Desulfosarcina alkanivorans]|uniref:tRNA nucleotidyltransferase n=1 Tax=Desulfosarcina alkanivorans TaxID=571177 RepID=A0A5K7YV46_9BACT|nr:HD domain-containing protein [Desulfosarcina alkanivorans]BBO72538.1 tRNA nucleotidyltransferase [Desulfosarcina alkanivorans]